MKNYSSQPMQTSGRGSLLDNPYTMDFKPKKNNNTKILKTESITTVAKNPKQDLLEYFKKERNTITQVTNNIKSQLQQSRSIDNLNSQKSERQKISNRVQTEEGNSNKKQLLKNKNFSLATLQTEQKLQKNILKHNQMSQINQNKILKSTVDQYFQDLQIKSAKEQKNMQQFDNQQYFTMKQNKQSSQQDSNTLKNSIEQILSKNKIQFHKNTNELQSANQSHQQKNLQDEFNQYDSQKQLKIILVYKGQKYHYYYNHQGQTTDNLYNYLIQQIACIEKSFMKQGGGTGSTEEVQIQEEINKICQFYTTQKIIPYDYYLSLPNLPLNVFQGVTLQLQPLNTQSLYGKKVSLRDFTLVKCIGVGGFSRVYLVRKRDDGKFYALKLIDKNFIMENQKEVIVQNERDVMVNVNNEFITPLHFAFETKYYIAFVLDYCAGGELFYHLRKLKRLTEEDAKYYLVEICIGMAYLHSKNIVYRDIKPENILLDLQGHLLLSDFGLSKPNMTNEDYAYSFCGSPEYMAPEMLLKSGHNYLVDCYCLGALLYELVTGLPPFYSHNTQEIYTSILSEQVQFPPYVQISDLLKDLICQLLEKDPQERMGQSQGIVEILSHPWFADINIEAIVNRTIQPPYKPEPLKYNFDEEEFNKGDTEFRKQYGINLQKEYVNTDNNPNFILRDFYFSREDLPQTLQHKPIRSNHVNLAQLNIENVPNFEINPLDKHRQISPTENRRMPKYSGKSEIQDLLKRNELSNKSASLIQSGKITYAYSKTLQQQNQNADIKALKQILESSKGQMSTERTATLPDQKVHKNENNRIKTEQFAQMLYPKTTTNHQFHKTPNIQKLFGSEKRQK
ncbi:unnamed protein product (macronuclear) [Paramecium tetraurelia]|uniref:Protein kinase domain-containing protein n=1 Tax=Paramecium tetraurelia TaxID=5888 RepID=A0BMX1_PARTE|nr:uncharacterized protein GSPATT00030525001 [Paramecium tetraurelia]CAK59888.1 unnamed protein product [Paramecium tetraurelia]|eukprot:XP_001427286.1 hypothetical protein (macronuclear) [Paramecium tetraurelia strain d4-2]